MTKEEIKVRQRQEEDYYQKKEWELSKSDREAAKRYETYRGKDPYPRVESALLNSADIFNYVAKTGMIYPFDSQKLQGASYEVAMRGTVIWWDEEKKEEHIEQLTKPGDSFRLEPNSIAFITLEPMFRIPDYMALRFNLKIVHVYKGLLLGTGPLVDPGFVGRLSIPLHNLTANTYTFHAGEGIIQMEFTKLSKNPEWQIAKPDSFDLYKRKWMKPGRDIREYITRSLEESQQPVVKCSIPEELTKIKDESLKIKKEVESFKDDAEKQMKRNQVINIATVGSIAGLVISVMVYACNTIYQLGSTNTVKKDQINELQEEYKELNEQYDETKKELEKRITELEKQLQEIEGEKQGDISDGQEN